MPDVLIYNDTTYHITDGRKLLYQGEWKADKGGFLHVEYPDESVLPLSRADKVMIKKTIMDFHLEMEKERMDKPAQNNKKQKNMHLKFVHIDVNSNNAHLNF